MNTKEVTAILRAIKTAYPTFYKSATKQELEDTISLWGMMFADDDPRLVTEAVKAMMVTLKYPPTIADIKEKMRLIVRTDEMTELEAWGLVYKAISDSSYHAVERFEELPGIIQRAIGTADQLRQWAGLDQESIQTVAQSNFMRSYRAKKKHEDELRALPNSTFELITAMSDKFKLTEG